MNLKKTLILLLLVGIIQSCNTDKDTLEKPESHAPIVYTFVKMEFINSAQSDDTDQYVNTPTIEISNRTSLTQTYPYNPFRGVYETSQFTGIDTSVINHIINAPTIAVPISTDHDIFLGDAKWPISANIETQLPSLNLERNIPVASNTKLTLKTKLHYVKISTHTRLTLIDDKEDKEHVYEGVWEGVYPINAEVETIFTAL